MALPKGFTPVSGSSNSWPGEKPVKGHFIQGTILEYETVKVNRDGKKTDVELCRIEVSKAKNKKLVCSEVTVWESAGLTGLFDEDCTECEVYIEFTGLGKKKAGQNQAKLYDIGINE